MRQKQTLKEAKELINRIGELNMSKIRITDECGLCVVRDLATGMTNVATYYDENISAHDLVVVRCENNRYAVRHIIDFITDEDLFEAYVSSKDVHCEVIGHVDTSAYEKAMEKADKKAEILARMEKRASEIEQDMYYKILAEQDEELAELYKAYSEL